MPNFVSASLFVSVLRLTGLRRYGSKAVLFRSVMSSSEQIKRTECLTVSPYLFVHCFLVCRLRLLIGAVLPWCSSLLNSSQNPGGNYQCGSHFQLGRENTFGDFLNSSCQYLICHLLPFMPYHVLVLKFFQYCFWTGLPVNFFLFSHVWLESTNVGCSYLTVLGSRCCRQYFFHP